MSTKHNTKHDDRNKSKYKIRLKKRGLSKAPAMTPVDILRTTQARRIAETCTNRNEHDHGLTEIRCNGVPWWTGRDEDDGQMTGAKQLLTEIFTGA